MVVRVLTEWAREEREAGGWRRAVVVDVVVAVVVKGRKGRGTGWRKAGGSTGRRARAMKGKEGSRD